MNFKKLDKLKAKLDTYRPLNNAINHKEAIEFVESLVVRDEILSEYSIKSLHALILKNIDDKNAGSYRNINVLISGATHP